MELLIPFDSSKWAAPFGAHYSLGSLLKKHYFLPLSVAKAHMLWITMCAQRQKRVTFTYLLKVGSITQKFVSFQRQKRVSAADTRIFGTTCVIMHLIPRQKRVFVQIRVSALGNRFQIRVSAVVKDCRVCNLSLKHGWVAWGKNAYSQLRAFAQIRVFFLSWRPLIIQCFHGR